MFSEEWRDRIWVVQVSLDFFELGILGWLPYVDTFFSVMFLFVFLGLCPNFMQKSYKYMRA